MPAPIATATQFNLEATLLPLIHPTVAIPKATIRIENPIAVLKTSKNKIAAQAFVKFLYSPAAQKLFGETGYRPVLRSALKDFNYPVRPWLFTIGYVGGWDKVDKQFFDPNTGVMAKIERGLGH